MHSRYSEHTTNCITASIGCLYCSFFLYFLFMSHLSVITSSFLILFHSSLYTKSLLKFPSLPFCFLIDNLFFINFFFYFFLLFLLFCFLSLYFLSYFFLFLSPFLSSSLSLCLFSAFYPLLPYFKFPISPSLSSLYFPTCLTLAISKFIDNFCQSPHSSFKLSSQFSSPLALQAGAGVQTSTEASLYRQLPEMKWNLLVHLTIAAKRWANIFHISIQTICRRFFQATLQSRPGLLTTPIGLATLNPLPGTLTW